MAQEKAVELAVHDMVYVAEQICETFVAYQLGIISNNKGWTNFRTESFGNVVQLKKFLKKFAHLGNS